MGSFVHKRCEFFGEQPVAAVAQLLTELVIGRQQGLALRCQGGAAAVLSASGGVQQCDAQGAHRVLDDGPCLGLGHLHLQRGGAQGMEPLHTVQQLGNAGAEALGIGEQAAG